MAEHNELGKTGEELAAAFLKEKGYRILTTNWRFGKDEIDLIARDGEELVIVEVKTRKSNYFGEPEAFVSKQKQKALIRCANQYIRQHAFDGDTRFDIVAILITPQGNEIHHIQRAFFPTL
ncbi:MAG: putative endonuclease [Bacteroidales bacterium]|jgi:putative endonuclease|nr:putative endonuclease [Bacteroidales bacterium]MDN5329073.1 putative endonuclease [Bacteroidales bacterium]